MEDHVWDEARAGKQYDVVVVGAGAAGCALAARLSEDPQCSVLLLEAGPSPATNHDFPSELLDPSTVQGALPGHPNNWSFAGNLTADLPYTIARGKILGGSTAINGTYFIRARRQDFDRWSSSGHDEWSYERVLPFLRKMESDVQLGHLEHHGRSGPITVTRSQGRHPLVTAFEKASAELGFPEEPDKNATAAPGYGPLPVNILDGLRLNTGMAYINPVRHRPNLTVLGDTFVRRVILDGHRAIGVEAEKGGETFAAQAGETVLTAGAVKSPHLLMLSGIGPREELGKHGIPIVQNLPGVGKGFTDHPEISVNWEPRREVGGHPSDRSMVDVLHFNSTGSEFDGDLEILQFLRPIGFLLTGESGKARGLRTSMRRPLQSLRALSGVSFRRLFGQISHRNDLTLLVSLLAQTSRGTMRLQSEDPHVQPSINYNYLATAEDKNRMREGVRTAVRILESNAFRPLFQRLTELDHQTIDSDDLLDEWMLGHLGTAIHLCGSAKFGDLGDPESVVDQWGRVHGIDSLRVADTSILPTAPSRGPAATAVLIGELVADFMKRDRVKRPFTAQSSPSESEQRASIHREI